MKKIYLGFLLFLLTSFVGASNISKLHSDSSLELLVHKTPTCGCCKMWVKHMEENGFTVNTKDHQSLVKIKEELKINPEHRSCHTGVSSQGHFFEGHIPSKYVSQFLSEGNPDAIGLSVPGMPLGSPGMEVEDRFTPYDVLVHFKDGSTKVYAEIRK
tara:strand:+ start:826 stop:1296 length:471 start_codon:yes stop_codon:yes gene_type:complete